MGSLMRTTYTRLVQHAELEPSFNCRSLATVDAAHMGGSASIGSQIIGRMHSARSAFDYSDKEVMVLASQQQEVFLYAWLTSDEFERLSSTAGKRDLQRWVASIA